MVSRLVPAVLLAAASLAQAQPYRWTDEQGRVHFGDAPPAAQKAKKVTTVLRPAEAAAEEQLPFELQRAQKDFPVTLYTAPICKQPCELARQALNKRGVPFAEIQVWNQETLAELKSRTGSDSVPALVAGRSAVSGFEQGRYDALLDSAGYPKSGVAPVRSQRAPEPPEGYEPPPTAEPVAPEATSAKPGPYDTSGLPSNRSDKPGPYDPSGLKSNKIEKPGQYIMPGSSN